MRIGIDARLWQESGVGRYIRNLIRELSFLDKKNEYVLFVLSNDVDSVKDEIQDTKFEVGIADIRWHSAAEQFQLPKILEKEELDLVHFPYFSVPLGYSRPFVVTIHDLILHHFSTGEASTLPLPLYGLKRMAYKYVVGQGAKRAKKIITVSQAVKDEIVHHLHIPQEKIVVTYEGFDERIMNYESGIKNKVANKKYFLHVGNVYPHKNVNLLIDAFVKLRDSSSLPDNDTTLVFVGKDDYFMIRLKEKVRKRGLEQSIIFLGEVNDKELSVLYKDALALVVPSFMEGFGLPSIEAMSCGCLVLASDIPVHREICQDVAVYFDMHSVNDLAEKMKRICYHDLNHDSNTYVRKGKARAKMFSWENMAKKTLSVYENIF